MTFEPAPLPGVWLIHLGPRADSRGWFVRTWCEQAFAEKGLNLHWPQANTTRTHRRGSLRGMHWQADPFPEVKLIRCTRGRAWDVVVDVRPQSASFGKWFAIELDAEKPTQIYVPAGLAHGFQCLSDDVELNYLMSAPYHPDLARGFRWDDPTARIPWPLPPTTLSERDAQLPFLSEAIPGPLRGSPPGT